MNSKILVIDDEIHIVELLKFNLETSNYNVDFAYDGLDGYIKAKENKPDLILLDWMLPNISGIDVLKKIRSDKDLKQIPVIMLTAKNMENDKIEGLEVGADDYITKPFRPRELVSRIRAALRRYGRTPSVFSIQGLSVDTSNGTVSRNGSEIFLSALEYRLLLVFINNPRSILTREQLLDELWDAAGEFVNDNTLTVYIKRLREKIEEDSSCPRIILTVRGPRYRLGGSDVQK